jgi:transcriptional regulator with XRE-family HTH domain
LTDDISTYGALFDSDFDTPEFKLETIALRLSHVIAGALVDRDMNRTDLARELGVSSPMVTKILSGRSNFTLKTLVTLADVLDLEFDPVLRKRDYMVSIDYTPFAFASAISRSSSPVARRGVRLDNGISSRTTNDWKMSADVCSDVEHLAAA